MGFITFTKVDSATKRISVLREDIERYEEVFQKIGTSFYNCVRIQFKGIAPIFVKEKLEDVSQIIEEDRAKEAQVVNDHITVTPFVDVEQHIAYLKEVRETFKGVNGAESVTEGWGSYK